MAGFEKLADLWVRTIQTAMRTSNEKVAALETRVRVLEQRPELKYAGVFRPGTTYSEGALVTRSGGLWLAQKATSAAPGQDHTSWKLVVKSAER